MEYWRSQSALVQAIEEKNCERAVQILDAGIDVDTILVSKRSAISLCLNGRLNIAQELVTRGCSLSLQDASGHTPLHLAVMHSDYRFATFLLMHRPNLKIVDAYGKTPVHLACAMNNLKMMKILLESSTAYDLNMDDYLGNTPLTLVCKCGSDDLISYLLSKGAQANYINESGESPLLVCMDHPAVSCTKLKLLLDAGAEVNYVNKHGRSAIFKVLQKYDFNKALWRDIWALLFDYGCDADQENKDFHSLLSCVIVCGDAFLVRNLLNSGCTMNVDKDELSPFVLACVFQKFHSATLLINAGYDNFPVRGSPEWKFVELTCAGLPQFQGLEQRMRGVPSLRQICRTTIRNAMQRKMKSVDQLSLPEILVKFLRLEDE